MTDYLTRPEAIAASSFSIIQQELSAAGYRFHPPLADVMERIIHSTADFDFAEITRFSPGAIEAGIQALLQGCAIVCDVNMVRVGVSDVRVASLNCSLHCYVAEAETREQARIACTTRSAMGIRLAARQGLLNNGIVVIGNAPTALYETIKLIKEDTHPALIIGVPVGFVNTIESKLALTNITTTPWIVTAGRKGGSPVAVAIVNALLRLAMQASSKEVD